MILEIGVTSSPKGNDRSLESNVPRSNVEKVEKSFSLSQWGLSDALETRVLIQSVPKPYATFPPTPMMLHIKFEQDWPTGFRDILVQKCEIFVTQGQVSPK